MEEKSDPYTAKYYDMFTDQVHELDKFIEIDERIRKAIKMYTTNQYYWELNKKMRNKERLQGDYLFIHNMFKKLFSLMTPLKESVTVYRSINAEELNTDFLSGQFVSTSVIDDPMRYPHNRYNDKCCFLKITVPPGTVCIPIITYSTDRSEYEVLLDAGLNWIITGTEENIKHQITYYVMVTPKSGFVLARNASENIRKRKEIEAKAKKLTYEGMVETMRYYMLAVERYSDPVDKTITILKIFRFLTENESVWDRLMVHDLKFRLAMYKKADELEDIDNTSGLSKKIKNEIKKYVYMVKNIPLY